MYQPLSSRVRAAQLARRGRYLPRVDLLEDRLAPGDAVLSQMLGMSMFGSVLPEMETQPTFTDEPAALARDLRLVQVEDGLAEVSLPSFDATASFEEGTVILQPTQTGVGEFLTAGLVDPLQDGIFDAVSAAPARVGSLNVAAVQPVGDGASAGFGGGTLIGAVSETPQVVRVTEGDLSQYVQMIVPGAPAIDPVVLEARNGNVPQGAIPPELDLSVLQNADHTRGQQFLEGLRAYQSGQSSGPGAGPGDPSARGPLNTTRIEYNLGDSAFQPSDWVPLGARVEVRASVHHPTGLPGGPYPFIVFMHGRHATCFAGASAFLEWPCAAGRQTIPSFQGYDYITDNLASWGFVVISVSANGINARDNSVTDLGMLARAQLIQEHLNLWNTWSTVGGGPGSIGNNFIGKVDLQNVGTMGHSRGGEGVVRHFVLNAALGNPYRINAVLPLAPVDFNRPQVGAAHQMTILPYCDGDVSDLQGMHFHDDARYTLPAGSDFYYKTTVTAMGANHNFFNTIWTPGMFPAGTFNDSAATAYCTSGGAASGRLTDAQQRTLGLPYIAGFFRLYNGLQFELLPFFVGDAGVQPPSTISPVLMDIRVSSHSPSAPGNYRRDINRTLTATNLTTNTLGGAVTMGSLVAPYEMCGGPAPQPIHCIAAEPASRQPHTVPSARSALRGMSQARLTWDTSTAFWQNDLPSGSRDLSGFSVLGFRTALNYADTARNPVGSPQDFNVVLTDGAGNTGALPVNLYSSPLAYPPGGFPGAGTIPKLILNSVRIPLSHYSDFLGVNLTDVRSVRFSFNLTSRGSIFVTDLLVTQY